MFLNRSIRPTERSPQRRRTHARLTRCSSPVCLMWLEERVLLSIGPPDPSASAPLILPASVMNSAVVPHQSHWGPRHRSISPREPLKFTRSIRGLTAA